MAAKDPGLDGAHCLTLREAFEKLHEDLLNEVFSSKEWLEAAKTSHKGVMATWGGLGEYYSEPHWDWGRSGITGNYHARFPGELIGPFHWLSELHKSTAMGECPNQKNRYKHHMHKRVVFINGTLDLLLYIFIYLTPPMGLLIIFPPLGMTPIPFPPLTASRKYGVLLPYCGICGVSLLVHISKNPRMWPETVDMLAKP